MKQGHNDLWSSYRLFGILYGFPETHGLAVLCLAAKQQRALPLTFHTHYWADLCPMRVSSVFSTLPDTCSLGLDTEDPVLEEARG